ncbi:MAG: hypothetical protein WCT39_06540 [Candidatus Margulisiibacteriota bacterium]
MDNTKKENTGIEERFLSLLISMAEWLGVELSQERREKALAELADLLEINDADTFRDEVLASIIGKYWIMESEDVQRGTAEEAAREIEAMTRMARWVAMQSDLTKDPLRPEQAGVMIGILTVLASINSMMSSCLAMLAMQPDIL